MMTVGEHDNLWKGGAKSIINCEAYLKDIQHSLKVRNAIEVMKELHSIGAMSDQEYKRDLLKMLETEGFTYKE